MGNFSLEYLYSECRGKRHCLGIELKQPVPIDGKLHDEIFVRDVVLFDAEEKMVVQNICNAVNTNLGQVNIMAYTINQSPFDAMEIAIELDNINSVDVL